MAKAKKLTDASKANESGCKLEEELKTFLNEKEISFIHQESGKHQIDFIIGNGIHVDCTNQNVEGSVDEKIPHKISFKPRCDLLQSGVCLNNYETC